MCDTRTESAGSPSSSTTTILSPGRREIFDPNGDRFGELLARIVKLSRHDVYDILEEQAGTRKRFGQIALAWGLCEPTHVWEAWTTQIVGRTPRVDLASFGVDAQATLELPAWLAAALGVCPVRSTGGRLVVAASAATLPRATELLTAHSTKPISFVLADPAQVDDAVRRYYTQVATPALSRAVAEACAGRKCLSKCKGAACTTRRRERESLLAAVA
ncbi:MAG TPA: hypothetical protein VF796_03850 [Humisphaera sp.]